MIKKIKYLIVGISLLWGMHGYTQTTDFQEQNSKYQINVTETDSVDFPAYFEHQYKIDSISNCYSNWHRRALAIENFIIKDCSFDVTIDSISRIVKLQNGKDKILTPNDTIGETGYTYEKEFKELGLLLFRVQWFEGNNYFLLNTKTGKKTYTIGRVFINPSKNLLISINDDIEAGYSDNGFQLFSINEKGILEEQWSFDPGWAPEKIKWIDKATLIVEGYYFPENSNYTKKVFYKLMKINER